MSTNAAMFGSIATEAMLRQKLAASKKVAPEPRDYFIQRPGTPLDGRTVSVPSIYLVAAPAEEKTDKTNKVTPNDTPNSRGNGLAEEDKTDRANKQSTTVEKPPVMEHLKTGPKSVKKENAQAAPEGGEGLKVLLAAAEAAQEATAAASAVAKEAATKVGEAKSEEAKKVKAVVAEMEKTGLVVAKIAERLIALDEKKNVAAVNIPKTGALRAKYDHALQVLELLQKNVKEHMEVISQLKAEAEEQYGATYNVEKRVSLFPASLQAALRTAAGFGDIVKGLMSWVKSIFGMAQDAEVKVGQFADEMEAAAKDVKEPVAAGAKVVAEVSPGMEGQIGAFVDAQADGAIAYLKTQQLETAKTGEIWDRSTIMDYLFEYLSEKWAEAIGFPEDDEDFEAFGQAEAEIAKKFRESEGGKFETMEFPKMEAAALRAKLSPGFAKIRAAEDGKGDTEFVKHREGGWVLLDKQGKTLGTHGTREEAMEQLKAVEWHKHAASRIAARLLKSGRVTADAMEKEIFEGPGYFVEDNFGGGHFIPGDVLPKGEEGNAQNLAQYCEAQGPIMEVKKIQGWWGRYQMPGYLDSTDWVFDEDKTAMEAELERVYGLDDEDADAEAEPEPKEESGAEPKPEAKSASEGDVEASFKAFQAALVSRTGLTAADAGIADVKAFQAGRGSPAVSADAWITGFIKANGLRDLQPVKA